MQCSSPNVKYHCALAMHIHVFMPARDDSVRFKAAESLAYFGAEAAPADMVCAGRRPETLQLRDRHRLRDWEIEPLGDVGHVRHDGHQHSTGILGVDLENPEWDRNRWFAGDGLASPAGGRRSLSLAAGADNTRHKLRDLFVYRDARSLAWPPNGRQRLYVARTWPALGQYPHA